MNHYDKREKRTLSVYVSIFFFWAMGVTIAGYLSYHNFEREFRIQAEKQISAIAELKVSQLVDWRKERMGDAEFLHANPAFSALVERYFKSPDDVEARSQLFAWLENYQVYNQYDWVRLLDVTGKDRLSIPSVPDGVDARLVMDSAACLSSGKIAFLDFQRDTSESAQIHISILVPIFSNQNNNHPLGVLALRINPQTRLYPYIQSWPVPTITAETLLVRRNGEDVLFLNELRFDPNAALTLRLPLTDTQTPAVKAVLGQSGVVQGLDYHGASVLADVRAVPDSPWFLISKMDTTEVFAPLRTRLWQTLGLIGMTIIMAGGTLVLIWRQQRVIFYRARAETAIALHESDERFKNAFQYSAIGMALISLQGRWLKVNPRVCAIVGYSEDELLTKTFQDVTHPEDLQADLGQVREMLIGKIKSYTMEKRYFHKDGHIVWVLLAVSLVQDSDGIPLYFISQIEDITERKEAEVALRESESRFRSVLDTIALIGVMMDAEGRITLCNDFLLNLTGWKREEILNRSWFEVFVPPEIRNDIEVGVFLKSITTGEIPPHFLNEIVTRQGDRRLVQWSNTVLHDQSGWVVGVASIGEDITERKQAEEALKQSEARFRSYFELPLTGRAITSPSTGWLDANATLCNMLGYTKNELMQMTWVELTHPEDMAVDMEQFDRVIAGEIDGYAIEKRFIHKDGHHIDTNLAIQCLRRPDRSVDYIVALIQDITERKQAEENLRESEERYRTMVSNAPVVTFVIDDKGIFTLSEGKGLVKLGLQPGQVVGLSVFDIYRDYPSIIEAMKGALAGRNQRSEVIVQNIVFDIFYSPVLNERGEVLKVIGVANDITERKQAEDEIRKLNAELDQRVRERTLQLETTNRELEAFSYSVSHDLRAPLRGIDGWSQALLEDYHEKLDEQGQLYIERVRSEAQRMGHLIDDMLQLSRLTRAEMTKQPVDLSALAQTVIERLKLDEPQRQVDFNIQAGLTAQGDSYLLEAVLANLLGNAFKFTGKRADARIEFGQTESQSQPVFFVRDNGTGFDMAYSKKLFGAFQRMHKVSEFPGSGIGLATVQRVIHRHGGRVWVEAEVDRGATFYFTLEPS